MAKRDIFGEMMAGVREMAERRKKLEAIASMPDSEIDTSDIPELTTEQMGRAVRRQGQRVPNVRKRQKSVKR